MPILAGVIAVLIYVAINFYIGWNGYLALSYAMPHFSIVVYWILFWVIAFSYLLGRTPLVKNPVGRFLKVLGSCYFGLIEFAIILLPIANIIGYVLRRNGYESAFYVPMLTTIVLAILIIVYARGMWNAWTPIIRTYEIKVPKKGNGINELRMAVASDAHLGNIVGNRHLRKMVEKINEMNPDIVLLPGDVIDEDIEPFMRNNMAKTLQQLTSRLGIYAVLGNHEYYGGHIEAYVKEMEAKGMRVLQDEVVMIADSLYIVGRKDKTAEATRYGGRQAVADLIVDLDKTKPIIMMDHQPYAFDKAQEAGVDVLLCGHTHRGQFAPNHWITKRIFENDWGYLLKDTLHVIVSSGYGTWGPPIRLASRAEILEVIVKFEQDSKLN